MKVSIKMPEIKNDIESDEDENDNEKDNSINKSINKKKVKKIKFTGKKKNDLDDEDEENLGVLNSKIKKYFSKINENVKEIKEKNVIAEQAEKLKNKLKNEEFSNEDIMTKNILNDLECQPSWQNYSTLMFTDFGIK